MEWLLLAAVLLALLLKLHLVFLLNLNWDEHHYLAYVHEHVRGELTNPWQTFHVHLFGWLVKLPGFEAAQLFAARLVIWGLAVLGTVLVYTLARRFVDRRGALLAALSSLSFGYLAEHGTSFRPDTLSAPFFLGGVFLLLSRASLRSAVLAGLLFAVASMVTIKSTLWVGVGGLLLLLRGWEEGRLQPFLRRAGGGALGLLGTLAPLWVWHRWGLAALESAPTGSYLKNSVAKVFLAEGPFPRWPYFVHSLERDALGWLLVLAGGVLAARWVLRGGREERFRGLRLLVLGFPLLTLPLYRNAFPYYYVFVLPGACVLAGLAAQTLTTALRDRGPRAPALATLLLALALTAQLGTHYLRQGHDQNRQQKALLALVHRMFPEPVPYIDRCSMVASFPKVGFFMSSWGMENYSAAGRDALTETIRDRHPPLLIANVPALWFFLPDPQYSRLRHRLRPGDLATLRENYVQHWGWLFVAGKAWRLRPGEEQGFEILIPGAYTLESSVPVLVDGETLEPGAVLQLAAGAHRISSSGNSADVILRWGERIFRPDQQPRIERLFRNF